MAAKWKRRKRYKRRRTRLSATNAGPILALSGVILGILGVIALILFVALPNLLPLVGVQYEAPWAPTPTPTPTPAPTPTPHLASQLDPRDLQQEMLIEGYNWYADPSISGGEMLVVAGELVEGNVQMNTLLLYDIEAHTSEEVKARLENGNYISPVFNANWIVYLDAHSEGGGAIRVLDRNSGETRKVKDVYVGMPTLSLSGDLLFWTERTGTRMDKLFGCDLNTLETVTVQMFSNSQYGMSKASAAGGQVIYADEDPSAAQGDGGETSAIYCVQVDIGKQSVYAPGTYVHDPKTNGRHWAWLTANHSPETALYYCTGGGNAVQVAEGVVDFGICSEFLAYAKDESIYVYFFDDKTQVCITPTQERTQFLNVSNDYVIWMDVTSRERDIVKFAEVK